MRVTRLTLMIIGVGIPSVVSCSPVSEPNKDMQVQTDNEKKSNDLAASETIGIATQEADGTIVLQLRATGPAGAVGDGLMRYPPNHPNYEEVKAHVGPIPAGKSVPVKPFD